MSPFAIAGVFIAFIVGCLLLAPWVDAFFVWYWERCRRVIDRWRD